MPSNRLTRKCNGRRVTTRRRAKTQARRKSQVPRALASLLRRRLPDPVLPLLDGTTVQRNDLPGRRLEALRDCALPQIVLLGRGALLLDGRWQVVSPDLQSALRKLWRGRLRVGLTGPQRIALADFAPWLFLHLFRDPKASRKRGAEVYCVPPRVIASLMADKPENWAEEN